MKAEGEVVEQIIRPTGLLDPHIDMRPVATQVDDIIIEAQKRTAQHERTLITTMTKKMAEDLCDFLSVDLYLKNLTFITDDHFFFPADDYKHGVMLDQAENPGTFRVLETPLVSLNFFASKNHQICDDV